MRRERKSELTIKEIYSKISNDDRILNLRAFVESKGITLAIQDYIQLDDADGVVGFFDCKSKTIEVGYINAYLEGNEEYIRNACLGDMYSDFGDIAPKDDFELMIFVILRIIIHEYKHYIQYVEGLLDENTNIQLDENNRYIDKIAEQLEEEALIYEDRAVHYFKNNDIGILI